jgi:NAD(P)-dependent dehydrogenase (short-subunit alcohol dehydrogenase family)
MPAPRTALITGGNRGIGLAVAERLARLRLTVVIGSRDAEAGRKAARRLERGGCTVMVEQLDVTQAASVTGCAERLLERFGVIDVLVNNAGIYLPDDVADPTQLTDSVLLQTLDVNLLGALRLARALVPAMKAHGYGRVVNVSSDCGSLSHMYGDADCTSAYAISKASVNALTRLLARSLAGDLDIKVNCIHPGWVRTDMGYRTGQPPDAPEAAAADIISLATLPPDGPTGAFLHRDGPFPW